MAKRQGKQSACRDCTYIRYCGGFRDRMARCPEWVTNKRLDTTAHDASSSAPLAGGGNDARMRRETRDAPRVSRAMGVWARMDFPNAQTQRRVFLRN